MRHKFAAIMFSVALAALMSGCNETANNNARSNANANANTNTAVANANQNANANNNTRRGPDRATYEKEKDSYLKQAKESGSKIGKGLDDGWLWVKTRFDLAAADDLRDSTINVDVDNNVVTLRGTVASAAQKKRAEEIAKQVEGVKGVKNLLTVSTGSNANANSGSQPAKKPK